jgi:hypothetical protein
MRAARGTRAPEDLPFGCRCGARWAGSGTAHCAAQCHRTFSGAGPFDAHRRDGKCLDPATIGMSLVGGRAYECWGHPMETPEVGR